MKLPIITVIILIISVQTHSVEPTTWAKQLIQSVKTKITNLVSTTNDLQPETLMPHEKSRIKSFMDNARRIKKLVLENIKPGAETRDPTSFMTTPQLITINDYPSESHTIVTQDDYILTLHRIPYSRKRQKKASNITVLLHHGLLGSSADWVLAGPNKSLAYILADEGYDVWMANVRGNSYSRAHRHKDPNSFTFWNFTFHEVSQYDLPAVIDYIKDYKGGDCNLHYIGHSMGTTVLFALLSTKTKYNNELKSAIALAPVAYMSEIRSPVRLLAKYSSNINFLLKLFGANEFLPQNDVLRWLSENMCNIFPKMICENLIFILCGHDDKQFDKSLLPIILGHVPAGASTLTLVHYAQEIKSGGNFQRFDYGPEKNYKTYGTKTPPAYQVENITLPISLMSSKNDWLASEADVSNLSTTLPNVYDNYVIPNNDFTHIDFLWATDAPKLVYNHILELLNRFDTVPKLYETVELDKVVQKSINRTISSKYESLPSGLSQFGGTDYDENTTEKTVLKLSQPDFDTVITKKTVLKPSQSVFDTVTTEKSTLKLSKSVFGIVTTEKTVLKPSQSVFDTVTTEKSTLKLSKSVFGIVTTEKTVLKPSESVVDRVTIEKTVLSKRNYSTRIPNVKVPGGFKKPMFKNDIKHSKLVESSMSYNKVYPANVVYKTFFT